jgi:esterase/lipase superfamily enzyme
MGNLNLAHLNYKSYTLHRNNNLEKRKKKMSSNRNAHIVTRRNPNSELGRVTYTDRRDENALMASVSTTSNNSTVLTISRPNVTMDLTGTEARTLYNTLRKHYEAVELLDETCVYSAYCRCGR